MELFKEITQIVSFGIVAISAVASTIIFLRSKNKEREKETYDYVDEKFLEFLSICLDKPYLDIFDVKDDNPFSLSPEQQKEEKVAFAYLMSIFERVYIFYHENKRSCDADQFINWQKTIKEYFERENFRKAWKANGYGWDAGFINFMDVFYINAEKKINLVSVQENEIESWSEMYYPFFKNKADNDTKDQIIEKYKNKAKMKYDFYYIKKYSEKPENDDIAGGMMTQRIGKAIVILYIFTLKQYRNQGYAAQAVRILKSNYDDKFLFLAESEHKKDKRDILNEWWEKNGFSEIDMIYNTPKAMDKNETNNLTEDYHNDNDLMIFYARPITKRRLMRTLRIYFRTSFDKPSWKPTLLWGAVKENNKQIRKFKKTLKIKI